MSFDVELTLRRGDFSRSLAFAGDNPVVALVGASGSGKSSALLALAGLVRPESGHVRIGGRTMFDGAAGIDVPARDRNLGVLFQDGRLFPHLSVRANLGYARRADADAVEAMAARLGLADLLDRWPRHLSGGEARRVALGRALLMRPAALLLDEPLAHLDADRAAAVLSIIAEAIRGTPTIYVTHAMSEAEALDATIVRMTDL